MANDLWPYGFPSQEFENWLIECPVPWLRLEVAENSATYKFILELEEEDEEFYEEEEISSEERYACDLYNERYSYPYAD